MSWFYRCCLRPILFENDSEEIHNATIRALAQLGRNSVLAEAARSFFKAPSLPTTAFGLEFPNPVGLAAGMDKDAAALPAWETLGFGFVELGAVTWHAQPGNPKPRIFRVIPDQALINRMGFNNAGAQDLAEKLQHWRSANRWPNHPVGINLGKSKITPLEQAPDDYGKSFEALWDLADFFVVNVSSPNTPQLRQLQDRSALEAILARMEEVNRSQAAAPGKPAAGLKPVLVKVAPDLSFEALDEILDLAAPPRVAGIVATNTTVARPTAQAPHLAALYNETGGLSGAPLRVRSTEVIRHIYKQTAGRLPIVGVGGIFTAQDAWEKITAGACLIQIYTGLVYEGPGVAANIVRGLKERLQAQGFRALSEAVGAGKL